MGLLSKKELARYSRHIIIPEFNLEGQEKLKRSKVLVVGSGGLGSPLIQYLAAAGVGTLGIVDFDVVDESNLQRQVLFGVSDIGKYKVEVAEQRIKEINPYVEVRTYNTRLTSSNALDIIGEYDVVADGTDNFPTRYLVNDACVLFDKVNVYASIFKFDGQVSVFNYTDKEGKKGPNYRDLFPSPPPPGLVPSCAEGGVLGVLPGIMGSLQANEVIKVITGVGDPLSGKLFLFDALTFETRTLKVPNNNAAESISELIDYEMFCGLKEEVENDPMELGVLDFKKKLDENVDIQLIDVREPFEYEIVNLGGELIPLAALRNSDLKEKLNMDKEIVILCKSGNRSKEAVEMIRSRLGTVNNIFNLKGGIIAYAEEIDQDLPRY